MNRIVIVCKKEFILACLLIHTLRTYGFFAKSPLRKLIITKAISKSLMDNISSEMFDNTVMFQQVYSNYDIVHNPYIVAYLMCYCWFKFYRKRTNDYKIFEVFELATISDNENKNLLINHSFNSTIVDYHFNIENDHMNKPVSYYNYTRFIKNILFIALFVFTKNVENVY
jgi:hypothetical protein